MKPTKMIERGDLLFEEVVSDRLSSKVRRIKGKISTSGSFDELVEKSQTICDTVTYLNENLRLLEKNDIAQSVILRSDSPDQVKQKIEFFELILRQSGDISLDRYSYSKENGERISTDFILSHDLIERLVSDFNRI